MKGCRRFTDEELEILYLNAAPLYAALISIGIRTGFRISETLSIHWKDIMRVDGAMKDSVEVSRGNMKGGTESRRVPMHEETKEYLLKYFNSLHPLERRQSDKVFPQHRTTYHRGLKTLLRACDILEGDGKVATHSFRKTFAAKFYDESGKDLHELCEALGHAHIGTTVKYLKPNRERINSIIKNMK